MSISLSNPLDFSQEDLIVICFRRSGLSSEPCSLSMLRSLWTCFQCPEDRSTSLEQGKEGTGRAQVRKAVGQLRKSWDVPLGSSHRKNNARRKHQRTEHTHCWVSLSFTTGWCDIAFPRESNPSETNKSYYLERKYPNRENYLSWNLSWKGVVIKEDRVAVSSPVQEVAWTTWCPIWEAGSHLPCCGSTSSPRRSIRIKDSNKPRVTWIRNPLSPSCVNLPQTFPASFV